MPSRNSKGQYISDDDNSIHLPSLGGLIKIMVIGILVFPWYAIISNKNLSSTLFNYVVGKEFCECPLNNSRSYDADEIKKLFEATKCPVCPKCPK